MPQPSKLLQQARFLDQVGRENIVPNIQAALDRANEVSLIVPPESQPVA
jgi:hypothetical protein